jgi:16S rRNA (guanine527-N7)-methyltransferase
VTPDAIAELLQPYMQAGFALRPQSATLYGQLATYLDLILKWNARTNLTAIRTQEEIARRHFGESLFAAAHVGDCATVLDFGSGAGFPGVPMQLLWPDLRITLAESQGKKAAFLREVCRELQLPTEVFAGRVETMPPDRQFDLVALRAVDNMEAACAEAARRSRHRVMILSTQGSAAPQALLDEFDLTEQIATPDSGKGLLNIFSRRS